MKLNQLRNIVAVAERGSVRGAALQLGVGQPALTKSIQELEREIGSALFARGAKGMLPTAAGKALIARAAGILSEVRRAGEEARQLAGDTTGSVSVAFSIAAHIDILPAVLRRFRQRYSDVQVTVSESSFEAIEARLREGRIDLYVGPASERPLAGDFEAEVLFENERMIVARAGHPLSQARSLNSLIDAEWATTSITFHAEDELSELFRANGLRPPKLMFRSQTALTTMIALTNSDLLCMVPVQWANFELTSKALSRIPVGERLPAPTIVAVRRGGIPLTPVAQYFMDLTRTIASRAGRKE